MIVGQAAVSLLGQWERKLAEKSKLQQLHDVKSLIIIDFLAVGIVTTNLCRYMGYMACIAQFRVGL